MYLGAISSEADLLRLVPLAKRKPERLSLIDAQYLASMAAQNNLPIPIIVQTALSKYGVELSTPGVKLANANPIVVATSPLAAQIEQQNTIKTLAGDKKIPPSAGSTSPAATTPANADLTSLSQENIAPKTSSWLLLSLIGGAVLLPLLLLNKKRKR